MLFKFYRWYDQVLEPWRLLLALVLASPVIFGLSSEIFWIQLFGAFYAVALILTRMWWTLHKKRKLVPAKCRSSNNNPSS